MPSKSPPRVRPHSVRWTRLTTEIRNRAVEISRRKSPESPISVPSWLVIELIDGYRSLPDVTLQVVHRSDDDCPWCAAWQCRKCGWVRRRANPDREHCCRQCKSGDGVLIPIQHPDPELAKAHRGYAQNPEIRKAAWKYVTRFLDDPEQL